MEKEELDKKQNKDDGTWVKSFLGEAYYEEYKKLLNIVIPCVIFGMGIGWLIGMIKEPNIYWFMDIGHWIGRGIGAVVSLCVVTAIVFIILERNSIPVHIGKIKTVEQPEGSGRKIKRIDVLTSVFFELFFTLVFILVPQVFVGIFQGGEEIIPVFNLPYIKETWLLIVAMWVLGFIVAATKFIYGRYNWVVVAATVLTNGAVASLMVQWLNGGQLLSQAFIEKMLVIVAKEEKLLTYIFTHTESLLIGIICFGLVVEIIDVFVKTIVPKKA